MVTSANRFDADPDIAERSAQALRVVQDFTAADAVAILALDPLGPTARHVVLASDGYPAAILDNGTAGYVAEPAYRLMMSVPRALRWRDLRRKWQLEYADTHTGRELIAPAGFREGASACLRVPGGRYVGSVSVNWSQAAAATEDRRDAIERLLPLLAVTCDLMRQPNLLARRLHPEMFARVLTPAGTVAELDDLQPGPYLRDEAHLWNILTSRPIPTVTQQFLWIDPQRRCHRVELLPCRRGAALVTERAIDPPHRLTTRELHVLHLVTLGASNSEIAARLVVSSRTAATHIEHLLEKLRCRTRAELAATAVREGLLLAEPPDASTSLPVSRPIRPHSSPKWPLSTPAAGRWRPVSGHPVPPRAVATVRDTARTERQHRRNDRRRKTGQGTRPRGGGSPAHPGPGCSGRF
ncbi:response regulator transcription factor [Streptomyces prunicolor]|uniref:response regulator transcription factor n=1 Tax=Streptomyces prunicolor TaxID=67348 RepID=UPI0037CE6D4A